MRPFSSKFALVAALLAASLSFAACGNKEDEIHEAETEGIYVTLDDLKYQVQISRALNPEAIPEDRTFVQDIEDPAEAELEDDEVWFAVFVLVQNDDADGEPLRPADTFEIHDQQGETYEPVELGEGNPFRLSDEPIPPGGAAPRAESVARQLNSIGGSLLLYKVNFSTLDNRPLELVIGNAQGEEATVELDV